MCLESSMFLFICLLNHALSLSFYFPNRGISSGISTSRLRLWVTVTTQEKTEASFPMEQMCSIRIYKLHEGKLRVSYNNFLTYWVLFGALEFRIQGFLPSPSLSAYCHLPQAFVPSSQCLTCLSADMRTWSLPSMPMCLCLCMIFFCIWEITKLSSGPVHRVSQEIYQNYCDISKS